MSFFKAFSVFALISFFMAFSLDASSNSQIPTKGFIAPLIHITSPEHPLYNPNTTRSDLARENARISEQRERYFGLRSIGGSLDTAPITFDMVVAYYVGTPPVKSYAIVDTGSHFIWQKCQPCPGCSGKKPIFDPRKSSSYQLLPCDSPFCRKRYGFMCGPKKSSCRYNVVYADNTTSRGVVSTDGIRLEGRIFHPGVLIPNAVFGCGTDVKSLVDGVMGFQNTSLSLPYQWGKDTSFSYCKGKYGYGGYLILGIDLALYGDKTPLFTDKYNQYQIIIEGIVVGGYKLNLPPGTFKYDERNFYSGVTIDSGTPFTRLHAVAYDAVTDEIEDIMHGYVAQKVDNLFRWCYSATTGITIGKLPSVKFIFGNNVQLELPNENVWINYEGHVCLQIFRAELPQTIIGAEQLNSYNVGFDLQGNSLWLSYQKSCPY